ncbi:MAG: sigma-54-dependent Fis family transcriptional regulator [bacterium]|nr:sigma-54-dependent Fis family transcriptional regulator [bacterium]
MSLRERTRALANAEEVEDIFGPRVRIAARLNREEAFEAIVARGPAMREVIDRVRRAAGSTAPLLVEGEAGCGKRAMAKLVHELSTRGEMPLVRVDCAARSGALVESELLGAKRGAVPGADRDREGLLQTAHRGTLLLENVEELDAAFQPKLREILATGEFRPVGDRWGTRCVDVRVIATSSGDLERQVVEGRFRRGLFDCLGVLSLAVPSLRERPEDIEPLLEYFAEVLDTTTGISIPPAVREVLGRYPWPGNVRELQNAVECACVMSQGGEVRVEDLPEAIRRFASVARPQECVPGSRPRAEDPVSECDRIACALERSRGDLDHATRMLGMTRRALAYAMARLGLDRVGRRRATQRARSLPEERLREVLPASPSGD